MLKETVGYKFLVNKLSGFAKFDLDTKINKIQFYHLLEEMSQEEQNEEPHSPPLDEPVLDGEEPSQVKTIRKEFS